MRHPLWVRSIRRHAAFCTALIANASACTGTRTQPPAAVATAGPAAPGTPATPAPPETDAAEAEPAPAAESADTVRYSDTPLLPRALTSFGAAASAGSLYVLGGYHGEPHDYSRDGQSGSLYRLDLDAGTWHELPGVEPLQSVVLVEHGGGFIRVGGMRARNTDGEEAALESVDEVARFDPRAGAWSALPALPAGRSSHDAVIAGDTLYVIGGWQLQAGSDDKQWHAGGVRIDLSAPGAAWEPVAVPFERRALGLAAAGSHVVAIGGMSSTGEPSRRVDVYDTRTGKWTRGPHYPGAAFGIAAVGAGGAVYASGSDGVVYRLTVRDAGRRDRRGARGGAWTPVATLMFPRFFHRLVAGPDGALLAVGGILGMDSGSRIRHVERIPIDGSERPRVARWTLAAPGPARNRQGVFLRGSTLYVFGGNNSLGQHDFEPDNFVTDAHMLRLGLLEWAPMAAFPQPRQTMQTALAPDGESGIAVGGFGHDGQVARTFAHSYVYDFDAGAWSARPGSLPEPRSQFGLARHGGKLWVFGGLDYDPRRPEGDQFRHLRSVLAADIADPDAPFSVAGALPRTRRAFAGAVLGDRYYLVGGMTDDFALVETCDVFDFKSRKWQTIPSPRRARLSADLVALDGKLYLVGGSSRGDDGKLAADRSIEVFDPATKKWSVAIEDVGVDTRHAHAMAFRKRLLLYTAHRASASPASATVELLLVDPS